MLSTNPANAYSREREEAEKNDHSFFSHNGPTVPKCQYDQSPCVEGLDDATALFDACMGLFGTQREDHGENRGVVSERSDRHLG